MVNFQFDPNEIVQWPGVGPLELRTAVRRAMDLPPERRFLVQLYRDRGKEPSLLDHVHIEELAKLSEFKE
jgi:hypothetical protein